VVAPVVEEFTKGLFLVGLLLFRRREFDGIVDGVVYAGIVAAGFAFSENILYLGRAVSEPESAGVLATLFVRGVASPFAHPLFHLHDRHRRRDRGDQPQHRGAGAGDDRRLRRRGGAARAVERRVGAGRDAPAASSRSTCS
jgi:hypothetical protein